MSVKFDIVFFDLDGTLADTGADIADAVNFSLAKLGLGRVPQDKVISFVGGGARLLIQKCLPQLDGEIVNKAYEIFLERYDAYPVKDTKLYVDVQDELGKLADVIKVVVTNKPEGISRKILSRLGVAQYFKDVIGGDTLPNKKPAPDALNKLVAKYGVIKSHCLMVGDSQIDIDAAKAAGVPSCIVTYGFCNNGTDLNEANFLADSFKEVAKLIKNGYPM